MKEEQWIGKAKEEIDVEVDLQISYLEQFANDNSLDKLFK